MEKIYIFILRKVMKNNLTKNDLTKFKNKIFKDSIDYKFIDSIPFNPGVYFKQESEKDTIGGKIIDTYFKIKNYLKELEIIKKFILTILKLSFKSELDQIKISREHYGFIKSNLIMDFKSNLSDTFLSKKVNLNIFKNFIEEYIIKKYHLFKKIDIDTNKPYFLKIFQTKYIGKYKSFILEIFNEYISIRNNLLKYLENNYGILSFNFMFELKNNQDLNFLKKKEKVNNINNSNNTNKYIFYNKKNIIDGQKIIIDGQKIINKDRKKSFSKKINKFNLLYINNSDKESYKKIFNETINKYYNEFKTSIDNTVNSSEEYNLYNVIINNIELDFNTLQFISYYNDPYLFSKGIDIHFIINNNINDDLNYLDTNYDFYLDWYNKFVGNKTEDSLILTSMEPINNFKDFFEKEIKRFL